MKAGLKAEQLDIKKRIKFTPSVKKATPSEVNPPQSEQDNNNAHNRTINNNISSTSEGISVTKDVEVLTTNRSTVSGVKRNASEALSAQRNMRKESVNKNNQEISDGHSKDKEGQVIFTSPTTISALSGNVTTKRQLALSLSNNNQYDIGFRYTAYIPILPDKVSIYNMGM